jgi:hypothetical protein
LLTEPNCKMSPSSTEDTTCSTNCFNKRRQDRDLSSSDILPLCEAAAAEPPMPLLKPNLVEALIDKNIMGHTFSSGTWW